MSPSGTLPCQCAGVLRRVAEARRKTAKTIMAFQSFGEMNNGGSLPNCGAASSPNVDRHVGELDPASDEQHRRFHNGSHGTAEQRTDARPKLQKHVAARPNNAPERSELLQTRESCSAPRIPRWKRVLDLTCVALGIPFWLTLMLLITAWIKIVSPGPVFYRQERVGYRGIRFMIFKFRSMKVDVETQTHERHFERLMQDDCPMIKLDATGDPRLIPCARLLRALGFDELPQIINVVRGEMSLVGPRPCTPHEFRRYEPWQRERVNAPPGLTGYWQVNGKNKTTFSEMIAMDMYYARNMSLWLDLMIIARTVPAVAAQVLESGMARQWQWCKPKLRGTSQSAETLSQSLDNV